MGNKESHDREKWCEWHIIHVDADGDLAEDPMITEMHPGCDFSVDVHHGVVEFRYACQIQFEIDNAGFDTLLNDVPRDKTGWYRARMRHYTIRGFDWSEIDCEYEVEALHNLPT